MSTPEVFFTYDFDRVYSNSNTECKKRTNFKDEDKDKDEREYIYVYWSSVGQHPARVEADLQYDVGRVFSSYEISALGRDR